jgi:hypothetical protein
MKILKLSIAILTIIITNSYYNKVYSQNNNLEFVCDASSSVISDLTGPSAKGFGHTPKGNLNIVFVY